MRLIYNPIERKSKKNYKTQLTKQANIEGWN
jgi:hypothetical protein